jgi:hypothetical protein
VVTELQGEDRVYSSLLFNECLQNVLADELARSGRAPQFLRFHGVAVRLDRRASLRHADIAFLVFEPLDATAQPMTLLNDVIVAQQLRAHQHDTRVPLREEIAHLVGTQTLLLIDTAQRAMRFVHNNLCAANVLIHSVDQQSNVSLGRSHLEFKLFIDHDINDDDNDDHNDDINNNNNDDDDDSSTNNDIDVTLWNIGIVARVVDLRFAQSSVARTNGLVALQRGDELSDATPTRTFAAMARLVPQQVTRYDAPISMLSRDKLTELHLSLALARRSGTFAASRDLLSLALDWLAMPLFARTSLVRAWLDTEQRLHVARHGVDLAQLCDVPLSGAKLLNDVVVKLPRSAYDALTTPRHLLLAADCAQYTLPIDASDQTVRIARGMLRDVADARALLAMVDDLMNKASSWAVVDEMSSSPQLADSADLQLKLREHLGRALDLTFRTAGVRSRLPQRICRQCVTLQRDVRLAFRKLVETFNTHRSTSPPPTSACNEFFLLLFHFFVQT